MSVNEKMTAIADSIRDKTGGTERLTLDAIATEIPKVFEEGKKAEYDKFWDVFQNNGYYFYAFAYGRFTDENYDPKNDIIMSEGVQAGRNVFQATEITDTKVPIYANGNSANMCFYNATKLKRIPYFHVQETTAYDRTFQGCGKLVELTMGGTIGKNGFDVSACEKLNRASIESIINVLSATTSGLTVTFSKEAVNNAFGIDIDDESTYTEAWNTLRNSKSNWTFAYN